MQTRGNGLAQAVDAENGVLEGICSSTAAVGEARPQHPQKAPGAFDASMRRVAKKKPRRFTGGQDDEALGIGGLRSASSALATPTAPECCWRGLAKNGPPSSEPVSVHYLVH